MLPIKLGLEGLLLGTEGLQAWLLLVALVGVLYKDGVCEIVHDLIHQYWHYLK
jgi:hypothetical protein